MRVKGTAIPFVLKFNLLAQLWSILQSQGAKRGSVDDQLTSRCRSHNKNSFCQIFTITSRVIEAFKVTSLMEDCQGWHQKPTIEHCIFQAASNNKHVDERPAGDISDLHT